MRILSLITLVLASSVVLAGCTLTQAPQSAEPTPAEPATGAQQVQDISPESIGPQKYTLVDVAAHSTAADCWMVIDAKVYDVSPMIAGQQHPGGAAILEGCGKDASELFSNRPNGSGAHSSDARAALPNYFIGDLATE